MHLFPGALASTWGTNITTVTRTNFALYEQEQCFFFVGIDVATGKVMAHTRFPDRGGPSPLWPFANANMGRIEPLEAAQ